jgi:phosphopantetheinyl transferase (holo-ACP synthase)
MANLIDMIIFNEGKRVFTNKDIKIEFEYFKISDSIELAYIDNTENYFEYEDILFNNLPKKMKIKYKKIVKTQDRINSILCYYLVCWLLNNKNLEFSYTKNGKPYITNEKYFNISHTEKMVMCILSQKNIGIDIEKKIIFNDKIARYIASDNEYNSLNNSYHKDEEFTLLWTKKESYLKCCDLNLSCNMKDFDKKYNNYKFYQFILSTDIYCSICQQKI